MTSIIQKSKNKILQVLKIAIIAVAFHLFSCTSDIQKQNIKPPQTATKFPPIKKYFAELDCVSTKRTFYVDEEIKLTFRLTNFSSEKLIIYEWMRKQEDNILIRFTHRKENKSLSNINEWKILKPKTEKIPPRQTLELATRNSTLVDKIFKSNDFDIDITKLTSPQKIAIIAALNLSSIKLSTKPIEIEIRPREKFYNE